MDKPIECLIVTALRAFHLGLREGSDLLLLPSDYDDVLFLTVQVLHGLFRPAGLVPALGTTQNNRFRLLGWYEGCPTFGAEFQRLLEPAPQNARPPFKACLQNPGPSQEFDRIRYFVSALIKILATRVASGSGGFPTDTSRILLAVSKSHPEYFTLGLRVRPLKTRTGRAVFLARLFARINRFARESTRIARICEWYRDLPISRAILACRSSSLRARKAITPSKHRDPRYTAPATILESCRSLEVAIPSTRICCLSNVWVHWDFSINPIVKTARSVRASDGLLRFLERASTVASSVSRPFR